MELGTYLAILFATSGPVLEELVQWLGLEQPPRSKWRL